MSDDMLVKYRVYLSSVAGHYERYDGYVLVWARDDTHAIERALRELRCTAFPDRTDDMWKVERIQRVLA